MLTSIPARDRWGVEPICRALQFAPSTYYATKTRPPSARAVRDEALKPEIERVYDANFDGVLRRQEGLEAAEPRGRRGRALHGAPADEGPEGSRGVRRGRQFKVTTISDENQHRPSDLVDRQFVAAAPNRLWVADLTYVKTHTGWVYVAFIIDVFSPRHRRLADLDVTAQ